MFATETVSNFMGLLGIVAGSAIILFELRGAAGDDPSDDEPRLAMFRIRVNRWLVGAIGIAIGSFLLFHGPL